MNLGSSRRLCSSAYTVGQKPFWSTSPKMRTSSQEARSSHSSPSAPNAAWKHREGRGVRGEGGGVPGSCPPRFLRSSGLHSCSCSQSSYVCALESEELQPALPGGEKKGPRKESSGGEGGGRGADAPRGPPTVALGVRRARASRHPLSLSSSPLCSSPGAA